MEPPRCFKSSKKKHAFKNFSTSKLPLPWHTPKSETYRCKDAEKIAAMASTKYVKVERVKAIEKEIKHDIASLVRALAEQCGPSGAYVHLGATSYDIVDTTNALQLKDATAIIEKKLTILKTMLKKQAESTKKQS